MDMNLEAVAVIQGRKVGRPKKLSEQKRTERVVIMLTPEEKQWLKHYIDEQPISMALREAIDIVYKLSPRAKREGEIHRLDDLESFIQEMVRALRNEDVEVTIKSKKSVIKLKGGHIFFQAPQRHTNKAVIKQILKELEQKCRNLTEGPPTAEFIFQDDRFKYVAPRIMDRTGYENQRFLGEPVFDLVHPDDRGKIEEIVQKGLKGKEIPLQLKFRALKDDGKVIYVNASAIQIEYEGYPAIVGSFIDLTEWKELQQDLEKLGRIVGIG